MTRFFMNNWVPRLGPLWKFKLPGIAISDAAIVSTFTTVEGVWDVGLLSKLFPLEIVDCVLAVPPPNVALGDYYPCFTGCSFAEKVWLKCL